MVRLRDVCSYVRSKNAGPFWITFDVFFDSPAHYESYAEDPALSSASVAALYGVDPKLVRHYAVAALSVVKISIPRLLPQGGALERDMHSGQQFVPLLDLVLQ